MRMVAIVPWGSFAANGSLTALTSPSVKAIGSFAAVSAFESRTRESTPPWDTSRKSTRGEFQPVSLRMATSAAVPAATRRSAGSVNGSSLKV